MKKSALSLRRKLTLPEPPSTPEYALRPFCCVELTPPLDLPQQLYNYAALLTLVSPRADFTARVTYPNLRLAHRLHHHSGSKPQMDQSIWKAT